ARAVPTAVWHRCRIPAAAPGSSDRRSPPPPARSARQRPVRGVPRQRPAPPASTTGPSSDPLLWTRTREDRTRFTYPLIRHLDLRTSIPVPFALRETRCTTTVIAVKHAIAVPKTCLARLASRSRRAHHIDRLSRLVQFFDRTRPWHP